MRIRHAPHVVLAAVGLLASCAPADVPERPADDPTVPAAASDEGPAAAAPGAPSGAREAPDQTFATLDGAETSLADLAGHVAVVNFWGTWCLPCRGELPELVDIEARYRDRGLRVIGIAVDSGTPEDIRAFLSRYGVEYEIWTTDMATALEKFGTIGYPFTLLIDRDGWIRKEYLGPQTAETLSEDIEALLE